MVIIDERLVPLLLRHLLLSKMHMTSRMIRMKADPPTVIHIHHLMSEMLVGQAAVKEKLCLEM